MDGLDIGVFAAELLDDLHRRAVLVDGANFQDGDVFDVVHALVGELVEQGIQHLVCGLAVLGEVVSLAHVVRTFTPGEWGLVEGDVANQIEGREVFADFVAQGIEEHAVLRQLVEDGLLALGLAPGFQEGIERGELFPNGPAGVVTQALGDELAVVAIVLDALGGHVDLHIVDHELVAFAAAVGTVDGRNVDDGPCRWVLHGCDWVHGGNQGGVNWQGGFTAIVLGRCHGVIWSRVVFANRITVESWVGKQLGGLLEIEDGEVELAEILPDARATPDDLLELGHRLDGLVQHDHPAGLCVHAGGHQLRGGDDDRIALFGSDERV